MGLEMLIDRGRQCFTILSSRSVLKALLAGRGLHRETSWCFHYFILSEGRALPQSFDFNDDLETGMHGPKPRGLWNKTAGRNAKASFSGICCCVTKLS